MPPVVSVHYAPAHVAKPARTCGAVLDSLAKNLSATCVELRNQVIDAIEEKPGSIKPLGPAMVTAPSTLAQFATPSSAEQQRSMLAAQLDQVATGGQPQQQSAAVPFWQPTLSARERVAVRVEERLRSVALSAEAAAARARSAHRPPLAGPERPAQPVPAGPPQAMVHAARAAQTVQPQSPQPTRAAPELPNPMATPPTPPSANPDPLLWGEDSWADPGAAVHPAASLDASLDAMMQSALGSTAPASGDSALLATMLGTTPQPRPSAGSAGSRRSSSDFVALRALQEEEEAAHLAMAGGPGFAERRRASLGAAPAVAPPHPAERESKGSRNSTGSRKLSVSFETSPAAPSLGSAAAEAPPFAQAPPAAGFPNPAPSGEGSPLPSSASGTLPSDSFALHGDSFKRAHRDEPPVRGRPSGERVAAAVVAAPVVAAEVDWGVLGLPQRRSSRTMDEAPLGSFQPAASHARQKHSAKVEPRMACPSAAGSDELATFQRPLYQ